MENNKLRELAQEFFDKCIIFQGVDDQLKAFRVENLYNFLVDNQWKIYADYEKNTHKEMIVGLLEESDYKVDEIPDDLIDSIVYAFENILYDDSDNTFDCCMRYAIDDYKEDLEEYKLEEE
jgi:GH18 family chitinase